MSLLLLEKLSSNTVTLDIVNINTNPTFDPFYILLVGIRVTRGNNTVWPPMTNTSSGHPEKNHIKPGRTTTFQRQIPFLAVKPHCTEISIAKYHWVT